MKRYIAEIIGTFALVFCGTGAIIINEVSGGAVTHVGIAITFGLVILTMIYALGDISGAHFNPAVSIGMAIAERMAWKETAFYIVAQIIGAFIASISLKFLFPMNETLGTTLPVGSDMQSFVLEAILTFMLMFVIMRVTTGEKEKGITAGIVIGSLIGLEAMFAGPISGASMNPARSLAPAIVSGNLQSLWVYLIAPILGAIVAAVANRIISPTKTE
jgi:aquaporin NIP